MPIYPSTALYVQLANILDNAGGNSYRGAWCHKLSWLVIVWPAGNPNVAFFIGIHQRSGFCAPVRVETGQQRVRYIYPLKIGYWSEPFQENSRNKFIAIDRYISTNNCVGIYLT